MQPPNRLGRTDDHAERQHGYDPRTREPSPAALAVIRLIGSCGRDSEDPHRLVDVLEPLLSLVLEPERDDATHLLSNHRRGIDPAWGRQRLQARSDIDA